MQMKKLTSIIAAAFMFLPLSAFAQDTQETLVDVQYLVVTDTAGTEYKFELAKEPVITFPQANMVVTTDNDTLSTPLSDVASYKFRTEKVSSGIKTLPSANAQNSEASFTFANATINGLKAGSRVAVYTANGVMVSTATADQNGSVSLELNQLPKGVYILHTPNKSFKIVNK